MFKIVVSSSSNNVDKAMDKYHDTTSYSDSSSGSSSSSSNSSSGGNTIDEQYTSDVLGIPLEVFQEQLRMRVAFGSQLGTSTNVPSSFPLDKVGTIYSCAIGVHSKTDEKRLTSLRSWYQIPDDLNLRLAVRGEWCCQPLFGVGVYEAYLLVGLRLPLNAFAMELLTRLGLEICQFNTNAWRPVVSM